MSKPTSLAPHLARPGVIAMTLLIAVGGCARPKSTGAGATAASSSPPGTINSTDGDFARANASSGGSSSGGAGITTPEEEDLCTLTGPPAATPGETLVYADEFDGTAVDTSKWVVADADRGHGTILNTSTPDMVSVHDGSLFVTADVNTPGAAMPYKAGFLDALGKFSRTYGKTEFRARFPYQDGVWYAIWATPATQSFPELDIELTNMGASQLWFVNHYAAPPLPADTRRAYFVAPTNVKTPGTFDYSQFHTYTIVWKPGLLTVAIDGEIEMTRTAQGVPDIPLVWKINSWVGGWTGNPTASTQFPVTFEVDYMHVYRLDGLLADPSIRITNRQSTYSTKDAVAVAVADVDEACVHVELYDGTTRIHGESKAPFTFPLAALGAGSHALTFVATDGVRTTMTSADVTIN